MSEVCKQPIAPGWQTRGVDCIALEAVVQQREAEYAALALAHDAAMAEAERRAVEWRRYIDDVDAATVRCAAIAAAANERADAAEAQLSGCGQQLRAQDTEIEALQAELATACEDGARRMIRLLSRHTWTQTADMWICDCGFRVEEDALRGDWDEWDAHLLAAWRAVQTKEGRGGD